MLPTNLLNLFFLNSILFLTFSVHPQPDHISPRHIPRGNLHPSIRHGHQQENQLDHLPGRRDCLGAGEVSKETRAGYIWTILHVYGKKSFPFFLFFSGLSTSCLNASAPATRDTARLTPPGVQNTKKVDLFSKSSNVFCKKLLLTFSGFCICPSARVAIHGGAADFHRQSARSTYGEIHSFAASSLLLSLSLSFCRLTWSAWKPQKIH